MSLKFKSDPTFVSPAFSTKKYVNTTFIIKKGELDFEVEPKNVDTAMLLLASLESEVIWRSLRALTKFAEKSLTNRQMIFDWDPTLEHIAKHAQSKDLVVKRYALKLLSLVAEVPGGTEQILSNPDAIKMIATVMTRVEDLHVLEFSTLCMSILTRSFEGCEKFLNIDIWNILFNRMKTSKDPDIQYNCLQILFNVLRSPECADKVVKSPQLSWSAILGQLQNKYLNIQKLTLDIIKKIVTRFDDIAAQYAFRNSTGIVDLLDVLNALYELEGDVEFCKQLAGSDMQCLAEAATGVANMTKWLPSAIRMSDTNVVQTLCAILEDGTNNYNVAINSLKALNDLCRRTPKAASSLIEPKTFTALRNIYNVNRDDGPVEAQRLALQCCLNLQNFTVSLSAMINPEFICELVNVLTKKFDVKLKISTCEVLIGLMTEEICKDYFMTCNGPKAIHENLRIEHIGFRTALCDLLAASVMYESVEMYLELGTVNFMIVNKLARHKVKSWDVALDKIFLYHPSAKFAYTGRLEINDITQDGFYVMKKLQSPFPSISQIISSSPPYEHPVYICKFRHPASQRNSSIDIRTPYQLIKVPESNLVPTVDVEIDPPPSPVSDTYDESLRKYLTDLIITYDDDREKSQRYLELEEYKYVMRSRDRCNEVSTALKKRAQLIAEFIADRMNCETPLDRGVSGLECRLRVMMHGQRNRNTRVICIGDVKCGGSLERSVLYKVLADRLGVPCSLHRIRGGHTWCEIAVPETVPNELDDRSVYPLGLLRPNYVVDLTFQPGRLLTKGSFEAKQYCGFFQPYYTVLPLHDITNNNNNTNNKENLPNNYKC